MLIEQITLEGFLSYKKRQVVDLSEVSTCLVLGRINNDVDLSNGAGKSSLFEAIPVTFFGKGSGRADLLDSYINDNMSKMYLETIFRIDRQRFKAVRTKTRSTGTVFELFQDTTNKTLKEATWKKSDKTIDDVLGLSAKTYSSTIYLNERESLQIITGTSSERKEILRELLNIDIYEKAAKVCNKNYTEYDLKMTVNLDLIKDKQKQLEKEEEIKKSLHEIQVDLKSLQKKVKSSEKQQKEKNEEKKKIEIKIETEKVVQEQINENLRNVAKLEDEKFDILKANKKLDEQINNQKQAFERFKSIIEGKLKDSLNYKNAVDTLEIQIKELDEVDVELKKLTKIIKEKTEQKSKLQTELATNTTMLHLIKDILRKIEVFKSVCPVTDLECPVLDENYKKQFKEEKLKLLEEISKKIEDIKKKIFSFDELIKEKTSKQKELEDISMTRQEKNEKLSRLKLELLNVENSKKQLEEKNIEFKEYLKECDEEKKELVVKEKDVLKQIEEIKKKIDDLKKSIDPKNRETLKVLQEEIKSIESELNDLRKQFERLNQDYGKAANELEKLEKMKDEIDHFIKNNEENAKNKKLYETLSTIFGKDGIQKTIMKESIPILEKYTLEFLKIFNEDSERIKIKFDLDPKRQDGEYKKGGGLEILVLEEGKEPKDLQMYSGGETVRIVFSIVLALAKLLSLRAGKKHEALIIDEKIAKLDSRGIIQFGEVIHEVSKIYKQVFVITHIDSLKNLINGNEIVVNKTEEGSVVKVS